MRRTLTCLVAILMMTGPSPATSWAESASDWFDRGKQAYTASQYETAIEHYSRALELNPQFLKAHYNRGLCFFYLRKWAEARSDFQVVSTANPLDNEVFFYIGLTYLSEGKNAEALAQFQTAEDIEKHPVYFLNSGTALFKQKKYHATIQHCNEGLRLRPDHETESKLKELINRAEIKKAEALSKTIGKLEKEKAKHLRLKQLEIPSQAESQEESDARWNE